MLNIILWFLCGGISFVIECALIMRNKEYNEKKFKCEGINFINFLLLTMLGVPSLISIIMVSLIEINENRENKHRFMKLLYKIANIGTGKGKNKEK